MSSRAPQIINDYSVDIRVDPRILGIKFRRLIFSGVPSDVVDPTTGKRVLYFRIHGVYTARKLLFLPIKHSLVFEAVRSRSTSTARIQVHHKSYTASRSQQFGVSLKLTRDLDGQTLIDFIEARGYNRFLYNTSGYGCRKWCEVLVRTLRDEGYVSRDEVQNLRDDLEHYRQWSNMYGGYCVMSEDDAMFF